MAQWTVDEERANDTLAAFLRSVMGGIPWSRARKLCTTGKVRVDGSQERDPASRVAAGAHVRVDPRARRERPGLLPEEAVVHLDADVVVVDKPAGVLSVPFDEGDRDTLVDRTLALLRRRHGQSASLGVVQRLDKDTTGLLVFARTLAAKRMLQRQLAAHSMTRRYLAIAHGEVADTRHETLLIRDRGDGLRGSWGVFRRPRGTPPREARRAVTHVRALEPLRGATLVECRLETGRQHQIRIHLGEAGHPLLGERVYIRDFEGRTLRASRPMLHAEALGFSHPRSGEPLELRREPPDDFRTTLRELRRTAAKPGG